MTTADILVEGEGHTTSLLLAESGTVRAGHGWLLKKNVFLEHLVVEVDVGENVTLRCDCCSGVPRG